MPELSSATSSPNEASRRKRRRNSGTESTGHQEESFAQLLVFDSGNPPPTKKVEPTATQHIQDVDETKAVKDITLHNLPSDQVTIVFFLFAYVRKRK